MSNEWSGKALLVLAIGLAAVLVFLGASLIILAIGVAWGLAINVSKQGLDAVFGASSWTVMFTHWTLIVLSWTLMVVMSVIMLIAIGYGTEKASIVVKQKPLLPLVILLGYFATLLSDLAKDYLPGAGPIEKNVFKVVCTALFAVATWLFESNHRGRKLAAVSLWTVVPLMMLLFVYMSPAPEHAEPQGFPIEAWVFVTGWSLFVGIIILVVKRSKYDGAPRVPKKTALP